jgi:hypothetical protein
MLLISLLPYKLARSPVVITDCTKLKCMIPNGISFAKICHVVRTLKWAQIDIHTAAALRKANWSKKSWRMIRQFG